MGAVSETSSVEPRLKVFHLSKSYGYIPALSDVTLDVGAGEVRGLLGPNGSGKSTLMKIAVGLLRPTSGSVRVLGVDVEQDPMTVKKIVGYVPESPRLYEFLTGSGLEDVFMKLTGTSGVEEIVRALVR